MDYIDIDELLAKQLAGEAEPDEARTVETWLRESEANQEYFDGLQQLWQQVPKARAQPTRVVDMETALRKVKAQIQESPIPRARIVPMRFWMQAAAAVLVLVVAAVWFFRTPQPSQPLQIAATDTTLTDTLTDGSVVVLNRNSGLRIAENFNRKERRMRLSGEAYFQVAHDTTRAFVVEVGSLEVQVMGTAFNVDGHSDLNNVTVTVNTGKVRLRTATQTELLTAGQQAVYENTTGKITRLTQADPNVLAYKNRRFVFDGVPLREVVQQLSDVYDIDISLKNKALENCPLTAPFDNLALDEVLNIIALSFDLTIERSNGKVVLDGAGCSGE